MKSLSRLWRTLDRYDFCFILFLLAFVAISAFLLRTPPTADEGTHSLIALFFRDLLRDWIKQPTFSFSKIYNFSISYLVHYPKLSLYYPPLLHIIVSFFYMVFGASFITGRAVVLLFSVGMFVMLYKTVKILFNGKIALVTSILFAIMPMVFYNSITMMTDIPYTFFFMLAMFFYVKAFSPNGKKYFILASIATALAFLTKWNAILIIPIVFAYAFLEKRSQMKNVIMSTALLLIIISPYMLVMWKTGLISIPFLSSLQVSATSKHDPQFTTAQGWIYYSKVLVNQFFTIPLFIASLGTLVLYSFRKGKYWKLFLIWVLAFYVFFTVLSNKEPRYMIPMVPALLMPLAFYITSQKYKIAIPVVILLFIFVTYSTWQLVSGTYYYNPDLTLLARETLAKDGNILVSAEPSWFYSSQYIFKLASMDRETLKFVYRPCSLSSTTLNNLSSTFGVRYIILPEPTDRDAEKAAIVQSSGNLTVDKIFTTDTTKITVYTSTDYSSQKEYCNFVCVLNSTICTKYIMPSDALK